MPSVTPLPSKEKITSLSYNKEAVTKGTVELVIKPVCRSMFVPDQIITENTKAGEVESKGDVVRSTHHKQL